MTDAQSNDAPTGRIADRMEEKTGGETVSVGDMIEAAGQRAYGPLILLLALILVTPIGSIPGASILTGIVLALLGGQMLLSRSSLWLPGWLGRVTVKSDRVDKSISKVRPALKKIDRIPRPRWERLVDRPWTTVTAAGVTAMAVLLFPLAFIPWGVLPPAFALLFVGLGLTGKDGLLTALGLAGMGAAAAISAYLVFTAL